MGWSIGHDTTHGRDRDVGYGIPAECDQPECRAEIDRGLAYVCGGGIYGGEHGCGLFFCYAHLQVHKGLPQLCERCMPPVHLGKSDEWVPTPFEPKPDIAEWIEFKLGDESWADWRKENPGAVLVMGARLLELAKAKETAPSGAAVKGGGN